LAKREQRPELLHLLSNSKGVVEYFLTFILYAVNHVLSINVTTSLLAVSVYEIRTVKRTKKHNAVTIDQVD
jgi:hypothetical protein